MHETVTMAPGIKHDGAKARWDLVKLDLIEDMAQVLTFGAKKYTDDNWIKVPGAKRRYEAALMRHLTAYQRGEVFDSESGLSHLDHADCCLHFLKYFQKHGGGE